MNLRNTLVTSQRVLRQLSHDPRTIALIFVVPSVLETLLRYIFDKSPGTFNHLGAPLMALFPFIVMFVVASVATLRERTNGTLERLLAMPVNKLDIVLGYAVAFSLVAVLQSVVVSLITFGLLGLSVAASPVWIGLIAVLNGFLGTALGLFVSAFATSEFQAVQFMPAIVLPQVLLCGLLVARNQMNGFLHFISDILPLTYSVDAMNRLTASSSLNHNFIWDLVIMAGFIALSLAAGAATLRRQTD
jgi:ABC-2 type transport system permease protein